jgi:hypothetical protein
MRNTREETEETEKTTKGQQRATRPGSRWESLANLAVSLRTIASTLKIGRWSGGSLALWSSEQNSEYLGIPFNCLSCSYGPYEIYSSSHPFCYLLQLNVEATTFICYISLFFLVLSSKMAPRPIFTATHPRACSTAFERVCLTCLNLCNCAVLPLLARDTFAPFYSHANCSS